LKTSATDYDLTGQIIWKAADIMSKYIIDELGEASLKGSSVLELGSGPGLCALIAQHWAKKVVLSDYQDLVMDLIEINMRDTVPLN
jgi:predicted nicotinamide N-methyase